MSATEAPPLILIWLRHLNHSLQRYDCDAKLSVDTNITDTPRPDLAPIWLRHPISNEYIYDCDAFYLWHTYDWDTPTRSCTHMTATPKIFFMIYILTQIWLRRSKLLFFDSTFDTIMTAKVLTVAVIYVSSWKRFKIIWGCRSHNCVKCAIKKQKFWPSQSYLCQDINHKNIFGVAVICVQDRVGVSQS